MNMRQVAHVIGVKPRTLRSWVEKGLIPFTTTGEDGRGVKRDFSIEEFEVAMKFMRDREEARAKFRL